MFTASDKTILGQREGRTQVQQQFHKRIAKKLPSFSKLKLTWFDSEPE